MIMTLKIMEIADEEDDNRKGSDFVKCSLVADVDYDDDDDDDDDEEVEEEKVPIPGWMIFVQIQDILEQGRNLFLRVRGHLCALNTTITAITTPSSSWEK